MIADDARPRLPRGVRLREDKVRDRWVLLAPERIVKVNPIAVEILKLCDGSRTLGEIVAGLAERFKRRSRARRRRRARAAGFAGGKEDGRAMSEPPPPPRACSRN